MSEEQYSSDSNSICYESILDVRFYLLISTPSLFKVETYDLETKEFLYTKFIKMIRLQVWLMN